MMWSTWRSGIVMSPAPCLGRGYGDLPSMTREQDEVRGALWQYLCNLDLPDHIRADEPPATTTIRECQAEPASR